jgi:hypothetical protein
MARTRAEMKPQNPMIMLPAEVATILVLHSSFFELRGWRVMVVLYWEEMRRAGSGRDEKGKGGKGEGGRNKCFKGNKEQYRLCHLCSAILIWEICSQPARAQSASAHVLRLNDESTAINLFGCVYSKF